MLICIFVPEELEHDGIVHVTGGTTSFVNELVDEGVFRLVHDFHVVIGDVPNLDYPPR